MDKPYIYIFVRTDLTPSQQIVQASHAALEMGNAIKNGIIGIHMVLIDAGTQDKLKEISSFLHKKLIHHTIFWEPDFDTGYTAIATEPLFGDQRIPMKRYKLHKGEMKC